MCSSRPSEVEVGYFPTVEGLLPPHSDFDRLQQAGHTCSTRDARGESIGTPSRAEEARPLRLGIITVAWKHRPNCSIAKQEF